ncbi:UNVERIFIED_CONTAM: hypothetical protein FKN15_042920 [Acipenser sinensis]
MSEEEQDALSLDEESFLQAETQDPDLTQVTVPSSELASEPEVPAPSSSVQALMEWAANFLQISGFQGQALGRSLAGMLVACRQLWLSQARVPDADKSILLDAPISPGHTFGPAVEEILQHSQRVRGVPAGETVEAMASSSYHGNPDYPGPYGTTGRPEAPPLGLHGKESATRTRERRMWGPSAEGGISSGTSPGSLQGTLHPSLSSPSRGPEDLRPQTHPH